MSLHPVPAGRQLHNRYRGVHAFFEWAVAEGDLQASPMDGMSHRSCQNSQSTWFGPSTLPGYSSNGSDAEDCWRKGPASRTFGDRRCAPAFHQHMTRGVEPHQTTRTGCGCRGARRRF
jgi:hypothetical protein